MALFSPYALGATLYMPATRDDILDVVFAEKLPELRSLVVCLEDAVALIDIETALVNLRQVLTRIQDRGGRPANGPLLFVRPRDAAMARILNDWPLMIHVDGFVVPKLSLKTLSSWEQAVTNPALALMPTLETPEVFNPTAMVELGQALKANLDERIIALRIGGNDLMGCLGLRRNPAMTLYGTPMGYVIPMLAGVMGSQGFALTAPVFEQLATPDILQQELTLDIANGLVGKTAIHPSQVNIIQNALRVSLEDMNSARMILNSVAPAVFKYNDAMCEPATHYKWATHIMERAKWHGVLPAPASIMDASIRLAEAVS
ncbi:HpcH/HpaI aldolase/citrate lyase family protein [Pseudomonas alliivorans]|uniref:HpcH/HpaI aldolase/citrate lyase family protein n=1 Tax=Pseudomonas alliivorans TaxID=2810613 RepID=A0ABS4C6J5_9PSED|nr:MULTISPECIES: HpcH/HpaI aldolase/citrate lyase family protein [Pseudomonas]MBP0946258.1 HpcH/HpaI aldolase/citrate lyase family protein [Pseudomonas alliivorans]MBP0952074.1 HpcH/HpaI aldolase/citrate lyase family protein [Pseudomonas alliivorans]MCO5365849.1 HpcH/HpaI aldolase/citrate lyase family protein [Pseudomonas alliivorans]MEE4327870.1 HpcH/HpaI aldolase/citrate lyase family protein [Pseudomonas alliivorans]MEE4335790.1 HpcH/HpaI aldolase/citrate lyase family protein [Pseudomonas al